MPIYPCVQNLRSRQFPKFEPLLNVYPNWDMKADRFADLVAIDPSFNIGQLRFGGLAFMNMLESLDIMSSLNLPQA
ncbi:MAG: hypothetical protein AAFY11_04780 [Cyanobacteria bacterium J06641_5]